MKDGVIFRSLRIQGLRVHRILIWQNSIPILNKIPELKNEKLKNRKFGVSVGMARFIIVLLVNTLITKNLQEMIDRAITRKNISVC